MGNHSRCSWLYIQPNQGIHSLPIIFPLAHSQKAIPFLAMATAAREAFGESGTAFHKGQYELIFQTCKQIMRYFQSLESHLLFLSFPNTTCSDFSQPNSEFNLAKDIGEIYNKYLNGTDVWVGGVAFFPFSTPFFFFAFFISFL
jgi:hypothetical protein